MEALLPFFIFVGFFFVGWAIAQVFSNKSKTKADDIIDYPHSTLAGTGFEMWLDRKMEERPMQKMADYPSLYFQGSRFHEYIEQMIDSKIEEFANEIGYQKISEKEEWKKIK